VRQRIALAELLLQAGHFGKADGIYRGYAHSPDHIALYSIELATELVFAAKGVATEVGVDLTGRGELEGSFRTVEQDYAKSLFHLLHVLASGGLADATMCRSLRHAACGRYLFEKLQIRKAHQTSLS